MDERINKQNKSLDGIPTEKEIRGKGLKECEPEITEIEAMFAVFEKSHNLEELLAITNLEAKDAPKHPTREPARIDLNPIVSKLRFIKNETNITESKLEELKTRYQKLSQAVGIINKGVVDHRRVVGRI